MSSFSLGFRYFAGKVEVEAFSEKNVSSDFVPLIGTEAEFFKIATVIIKLVLPQAAELGRDCYFIFLVRTAMLHPSRDFF